MVRLVIFSRCACDNWYHSSQPPFPLTACLLNQCPLKQSTKVCCGATNPWMIGKIERSLCWYCVCRKDWKPLRRGLLFSRYACDDWYHSSQPPSPLAACLLCKCPLKQSTKVCCGATNPWMIGKIERSFCWYCVCRKDWKPLRRGLLFSRYACDNWYHSSQLPPPTEPATWKAK